MRTIRVLVVDDTTLMRQGLRSLLESREGIELVGEAADAQEALHLAEAISPDVILIDQDMPGLDTVEVVRILKQRVAAAEVIVLAEWADPEKAFRMMEVGATAYVLKDINIDNLVRAIEGVRNGRTMINPRISRQLLDRFRVLMREKSDKEGLHVGGLTTREMEILLEMTKGATDREIANKMFLGATTVKSHIRSIFRKIGVKNRTQAVAYVLQNGLASKTAAGGPHGNGAGNGSGIPVRVR